MPPEPHYAPLAGQRGAADAVADGGAEPSDPAAAASSGAGRCQAPVPGPVDWQLCLPFEVEVSERLLLHGSIVLRADLYAVFSNLVVVTLGHCALFLHDSALYRTHDNSRYQPGLEVSWSLPPPTQVPVLDPLSLAGQAITPAALAASKWVPQRACGAKGLMPHARDYEG